MACTLLYEVPPMCQRPLAGGAHALGAVALDQALQAQARPIAMLGMRTRVSGSSRSARPPAGPMLRAPGHQLRRRPLQVRAVRRGHVLWLGDEPLSTVLAHMAGHPSATMEDLDHVGRGAHLDRFT